MTPKGPSGGKLEPRDRIVAVDGTEIGGMEDLFAALDGVSPGDKVEVGVRRSGADRTFEITTAAAQDDKKRAILGVLVGIGYQFPFDVHVGIDESIGGPSAGLVFALSVYDTLTPGALTGGDVVAGTGTIAPDGTVGPIGGIREKLIAAARSDAEIFLVPPRTAGPPSRRRWTPTTCGWCAWTPCTAPSPRSRSTPRTLTPTCRGARHDRRPDRAR